MIWFGFGFGDTVLLVSEIVLFDKVTMNLFDYDYSPLIRLLSLSSYLRYNSGLIQGISANLIEWT